MSVICHFVYRENALLTPTMDVHLLAATSCVCCVVLILYLQQFFVITALKRLLAEEREHNAETTGMLETSFAAIIRRLEARTGQTENGIEAVMRHRTGTADRSAPRNTVHSRAGVADGWMNENTPLREVAKFSTLIQNTTPYSTSPLFSVQLLRYPS